MATRKTASKTSKKATINFNWDTNKPRKKTTKKINKNLKKLSVGAILVAVMLLVVGAVGGFFGLKVVMKNDCFALNGKDEITLELGKSYIDEGAKVIAFGKNEADKVIIETNLTKNADGTYSADEIGTYYMIYKVENIKYGKLFKVQKIRLITFVEVSEGAEYEK